VVEGEDESHCDDCLGRLRVDVPEQPGAERFPGRSDSQHHRAALAKIDQELRTIERLATRPGR
jgi:hypothetical protein